MGRSGAEKQGRGWNHGWKHEAGNKSGEIKQRTFILGAAKSARAQVRTNLFILQGACPLTNIRSILLYI